LLELVIFDSDESGSHSRRPRAKSQLPPHLVNLQDQKLPLVLGVTPKVMLLAQ
jgi:hypothetical protein